MSGLLRSARFAVVLGVISVFGVILSHLALTDIAHGEPDVVAEWWVLRVSFAAIVVFQAVAITTLVRFIKAIRSEVANLAKVSS